MLNIYCTCQCTKLPPAWLCSSFRGSDLAATPCINNCINITLLSVLCHSKFMSCHSCKLVVFQVRFELGAQVGSDRRCAPFCFCFPVW